jgi:chromosome segregation ATPase
MEVVECEDDIKKAVEFVFGNALICDGSCGQYSRVRQPLIYNT